MTVGQAAREQTIEQQRERLHADFERRLTWKPPTGTQAERYTQITEAAKEFGHLLIELGPPSAELTLALRDIESARMRANQNIAVNE